MGRTCLTRMREEKCVEDFWLGLSLRKKPFRRPIHRLNDSI